MKTLFDNKKGSEGDMYVAAEKPFKHIVFIIIVSAVIILFLSYATSFMSSKVHVPETLKGELLMQRMQNICLATTDPVTGTPIENVIDYSKFNSETLNNCFSGENTPGLSVELNPLDRINGQFDRKVIKIGHGGQELEYLRYTIVDIDGIRYPAEMVVRA
ncbi:MAG: hypothetical protein ACOCU6_00175 [Nanoarchaeota archaeon]